MARAGVRVSGATRMGGRRPPVSATGRGTGPALVAALPALALPLGWNGSLRLSEPEPAAPPTSDPRRGRLRRLFAALDLALEAIAAPALVLARDGRILRANAIARATLGANAAAIPPPLAAAPRNGKNRPAAAASASIWDLTPVGRGGETVAFLAIMHAPEPEQALAAAVDAASRRWKLTARQVEILELVARGLTNDLIADTLGIGQGTVEFHISGIFDKAGVCNRATLIMRALEMGRR